jgi:large subunit ribosomal protein L15
MPFKVKKQRKSKRWRGRSTYGHGARKKWMGSGGRGGCGMAGSGKRADQKKSLVIKLYGNKYFGKQGITSKATAKKINDVINVGDIQKNLNSLLKKYGKENELNFEGYKILGEGELVTKLKIKANSFSESARKKIEKAGGEAIVISKNEGKKIKKAVKEIKTEEKAIEKKPRVPLKKKV